MTQEEFNAFIPSGEFLTLSGMAIIAIYLILTGKLVPRSTLEDQKATAKTWEEAFHKIHESQQIVLQAEKNQEKTVAEVIQKHIESLPNGQEIKELLNRDRAGNGDA